MITEKLSVVIPAYNEGEKICENLLEMDKVIGVFSNDFELIVVNDGSADNTLSECERAAAQCSRITVVDGVVNQGKGGALKLGVSRASGEGLIAFLDADLDLNPDRLDDFYQRMCRQDADIVIGSKLHPESVVDYPSVRKVISYIYYIVLRMLFGLNVHDTQTGIKLFRARVIKRVMEVVLVKRFAYDIEVLSICSRLGSRIIEAPVDLTFMRAGQFGRIRLNDIFSTAWDTLAVFKRLKLQKYYDKELGL